MTFVRVRACTLALVLFAISGRSEAEELGDPVMDDQVYVFALLELAEYQFDDETNPAAWELLGWVGGDYNRIWFKSEGSVGTTETQGDGDLELLYGRLITPWWDLQAGIRGELQVDGSDEQGRVFAALGIEGLAPGYFDVDATLFVSHEGDVSGRFTAAYDAYVTQRLIAEPRVEIEAAVQEVPEFAVGSGLNTIELGFRVRYEVRRELAPYIGVHWQRSMFETADLMRERDEVVSAFSVVAGLRIWH